MSCHCSKTPIPSYYAVFIDYGRKGLEAIIDPEMTRANVIDRIKSGEWQHVAFIHFVEEGEPVENVTRELLDEAESEQRVERLNAADRLAYRHDHERGLRVAS